MKIKILLLWIMAIPLMMSCNKDDDNDSNYEEYIVSEQYKSDVETFADFATRKEYLILTYFEITSNGYTTPIMGGDFSYMTESRVNDFWQQVADILENEEEYRKAFKNMESNGVFTHPTRRGMMDSAYDFFVNSLYGAGKRSRERTIKVLSNLDASDRSRLYESVVPNEWKSKASDEADFWKKLKDGELDNQASQMFNRFSQYADSEFGATAADKDLTIGSIVFAEGADMVEKGAAFSTDVVGTVTGLGTGITVAQIADKTANLISVGDNIDKSKVATRLSSDVVSLIIPQSDLVADGLINTYESWFAQKKAKASQISTSDNSCVNVVDEDTESPMQIVIAQKQNANSSSGISIVTIIGNAVNAGKYYSSLALSAGKWFINAIDQQGNKATILSEIPKGEDVEVLLITEVVADETDSEDLLYGRWWCYNTSSGIGTEYFAEVAFEKNDYVYVFNNDGTGGYSSPDIRNTYPQYTINSPMPFNYTYNPQTMQLEIGHTQYEITTLAKTDLVLEFTNSYSGRCRMELKRY